MTTPNAAPVVGPRRRRATQLSPREELFHSTAEMRRWATRRWAWGNPDAEQAAAAEVWAAITAGETDPEALLRAASRGACSVKRCAERASRRSTRYLSRDVVTVDSTDFADHLVEALDAQRAIRHLVDTMNFPVEEMSRWADRKAGAIVADGPMPGRERKMVRRWSQRARAALEEMGDAA